MKRTGAADLPLHPGRAPRWLFKRMQLLSKAITDAIILEFGEREFITRISNPYWFQALSCIIGFDWHSSGTTTTTCGALKSVLTPEEHGITVAGGKGAASRNAPSEIREASEFFGLSTRKAQALEKASRLAAKVDGNCVQDGFSLYHHSFFLTEKGEWCVVQQGMNERTARRYHWLGAGVDSFVQEPHSGIACDFKNERVLDLTSRKSAEAHKASVDLVNDNPVHIKGYFTGQKTLNDSFESFRLPSHHPVLKTDLTERSWSFLQNAFELQPQSYEELVSLKGIGAKSLRALALLSELLFGAQPSWEDPVKYSFAHGGKDGFPYPVDRENYDASISFLSEAVSAARIDSREKMGALRRLHALAARE